MHHFLKISPVVTSNKKAPKNQTALHFYRINDILLPHDPNKIKHLPLDLFYLFSKRTTDFLYFLPIKLNN